jgi:hypothetical protein
MPDDKIRQQLSRSSKTHAATSSLRASLHTHVMTDLTPTFFKSLFFLIGFKMEFVNTSNCFQMPFFLMPWQAPRGDGAGARTLPQRR